MQIHRKLIILVSLGLLLILSISVFSVLDNAAHFPLTTQRAEQLFAKLHQSTSIEKNITAMSLAAHGFNRSGGAKDRLAYEVSRAHAHETLKNLTGREHTPEEDRLLAALRADIGSFEQMMDHLVARTSRPRNDRVVASDGADRLDSLIGRIGKTIKQYQDLQTTGMADFVLRQKNQQTRTGNLLILNMIVSTAFLLGLGIYLHHTIAKPLSSLWKRTEGISSRPDYPIEMQAEGEIALLAERFNDMTRKLMQSHAELEQKLQNRTQALAALDAVALTLSESRSMRDLLSRSLDHIFNNLTALEPRGGVFLCDPDGKTLRLSVQKGLPLEFAQQEETIRVGECLCGIVAQTGEMLVSQRSCEDPRHTRSIDAHAHSHIIIPIKSRGIVLGVIFLYPGTAFALKPSDTQLLETIGAQIGLAVENFRFYSEVKASSEKFWDLFENAREILITVDTEGRVTAANNAAETFFGSSRIELTGKSLLEFCAESRDQEIVRRMLAGEDSSENQVVEIEGFRTDRSRAFLEISFRKLFKNRVQIGCQVSARDVTEQKALREMVLKAERLGALGQMGVAVRHEINNPLTTVIGNIELLIERYEDKDTDLTRRLEVVLNNALRIAEIVKRLQEIKQDKVVDYLKGIKMTDLQ